MKTNQLVQDMHTIINRSIADNLPDEAVRKALQNRSFSKSLYHVPLSWAVRRWFT